jgi:hypothetical protein
VADHLQLPDPAPLPSRRVRRPPLPPHRNPRRHGGELAETLDDAVERAREIPIVEGVDPALVFRVRAGGRIDPLTWGYRGLELLSEGEDWDYVVLSPGTEPPRVGDDLSRYAAGPDEEGAKSPLASFFAWVEAFEPYGPEDRLPSDVATARELEDGIVDIVIWPARDEDEAADRVRQVRRAVEHVGGEVVAADQRPRSPVVRASVNGAGVRALATVPVVEVLQLPAVPYVDPSDWRDARIDDLDVRIEDRPPVGVLDDAIASGHELLRDVVAAERSFPDGRAWQPAGEHGTMVGGLAAYGDFEQPLRDGAPLVAGPIVQARVIEQDPTVADGHRFPPEQPEHLTVEDAIRTAHGRDGVRVFVMSVTRTDPYLGPRVSVLTERLDDLARELDIVIVVPSGNHGATLATARMRCGAHAADDYPGYLLEDLARISEPATAALALTVGSVARSAGPARLSGETPPGYSAIAPVDGISPFSRSGPGAFRAIKPDVVHYGGNWVTRPDGTIAFPEAGAGVVSLCVTDTGRLFAMGTGTSYAAPRIANLAAQVLAVYGDVSANLVRALIGLASHVPDRISAAFGVDACRVAGYGMPLPGRAAASTGSRVVLMTEGEMPTDTVAIHPVPVPAAFHEGKSARSIRVALAFDPPVRRTRREYVASQMNFDLIRATTLDEVAAIYREQDPDAPRELPAGRRRLQMEPTVTTTGNSTLIVRGVRRQNFPDDDGDTYYLAVTHRNRAWAGSGDQRYGLAVEFEDEERQNVDLYAQLETRVGVRQRVRARVRR